MDPLHCVVRTHTRYCCLRKTTFCVGLNGKSIFSAPFGKEVQAYKNKLAWAAGTFSDCLAVLQAYQVCSVVFRIQCGSAVKWSSGYIILNYGRKRIKDKKIEKCS